MTLDGAIARVAIEARRASDIFDTFNSPHEAYAVLLEEVDELWEEIKDGRDHENMAAEAVQVAAMAVRFLTDCV